jgi:hypothetical protein
VRRVSRRGRDGGGLDLDQAVVEARATADVGEAWCVSSLPFLPSAASFRHQTPRPLTTPGRARSPTTALQTMLPRSLKMRTRLPSSMPRAAASTAEISSTGSPSIARRLVTLTKLELRKLRAGGEIIASGKRRASSGVLVADS